MARPTTVQRPFWSPVGNCRPSALKWFVVLQSPSGWPKGRQSTRKYCRVPFLGALEYFQVLQSVPEGSAMGVQLGLTVVPIVWYKRVVTIFWIVLDWGCGSPFFGWWEHYWDHHHPAAAAFSNDDGLGQKRHFEANSQPRVYSTKQLGLWAFTKSNGSGK